MVRKKIKFMKEKTTINILMVLVSTVISSGVGFLFFTFLAKELGPSNFGDFNLINETIGLLIIISDFGLTIGFIKYNSQYFKNDIERSKQLLKLTLEFKLFISTIATIGLVLFSYFTFSGDMYNYLLLGSLQIILMTSYSFFGSVFQSQERFLELSMIKIFNSILKIGILYIIRLFMEINIINAISILLISSLIVDMLSIFIINPKNFVVENNKKIRKELFKKIFNFSKWVMVSNFIVAFITRLDLIMLKNMASNLDLGYYSAGQKLAFAFPVISQSITTVLLPSASKIDNSIELRQYLKKSMGIITLILIPLIVGILFSDILIDYLLGDKYIGSIKVFKIIGITFVVELIFTPLSILLYRYNEVKYITFIQGITLLVNFVANFLLINKYGAVGAAYGTMISRVIGIPPILFKIKSKLNEALKD